MEDLLMKMLAEAPLAAVMGGLFLYMLKQQAKQMDKCAETLSNVSKSMEGMRAETKETKEMVAELQETLTPRAPRV